MLTEGVYYQKAILAVLRILFDGLSQTDLSKLEKALAKSVAIIHLRYSTQPLHPGVYPIVFPVALNAAPTRQGRPGLRR